MGGYWGNGAGCAAPVPYVHVARVVYSSLMPVSAGELYAWHARAGAFERLMPPWEQLQILEKRGGIEDGAHLAFEMRKGPLRLVWVATHRGHTAGQEFTDEQVRGPFASWAHTHRFLAEGEGSRLEDDVSYVLPGGRAGEWAGGAHGRRVLDRMFAFRHERTRRDLLMHAQIGGAPMQIAMTGSSGAIGGALRHFLTTGGHTVRPMVRRKADEEIGEIFWQPGPGARGGQIDEGAMEGIDAVVHLAGEPIARGRWTDEKKEEIRQSRVSGTRLIARTVAGLQHRPRVLVVASGIHYYGDRGDQELSEAEGVGSGFLAEVARDWEAAVEPAVQAGIRVVVLRIGLVLSARSGLVRELGPLARLGLMPVVGSGRQWWSWIGEDDLLGVVLRSLTDGGLHGAVNAVSPAPVRMEEFAWALSRVHGREPLARVPAWAVQWMVGEKAEVATTSTRAAPEALRQRGHRFMFPRVEDALMWQLHGRVRGE
jgi:uncharacterized protein (TIGR01777 family)